MTITLQKHVLFSAILLLGSLMAIDPLSAQTTESLRVMAWNIWHGGKEDGETVGPKRVVEIIRDSNADIIAMQETYGSGEFISGELKFHFHPRGTNVSIHSRYPVVEDISVFEEFKCVGALIQLPDERLVAFYSIWLPYNQEIWEEGTRNVHDLKAMRHACQASCDDLKKMRVAIADRLKGSKYNEVPVIIAGDFNSMSHFDYVPSFKNQFDDVVIDWPTSHVMIDNGYLDSWREIYPEVDRNADRTWSPRFPGQQQDRIDFIYYKPARSKNVSGLQVRDSFTIDTKQLQGGKEGFPSDHAALVTEFFWPESSTNLVKIASYNIKHGFGNDSKLDLKRTASVIRNLKADVIGLQEVDVKCRRSNGVDQPAFLAGHTEMEHHAFAMFMNYDGGEYGLSILSRYPIESSEQVRLKEGNEPRAALACKIRLPNGRLITAINIHFDWVGDDKFRFEQASQIANYLRTVGTPWVLVGDFNDGPDSRTLKLFSDDYLLAAKPKDDAFTFSAADPKREIDFIFAGPQEHWKHLFSRVHDGRITSDHRPITSMWYLK